ncbi:hypothetical protein FEK33_02545 [Nocardia asteroides NBRC 15531]|jgi:hypothetical protein|uniref:Uncharacterized protein n=1 Tax=Nocardia asteroides NBRC 15531 TaxID=1110697 RepID=U5EDR2_NOCAS|nr:DUF6069 family protein [Nocardia asteroides]TLF69212.1 hypothetical protein FEK33_02545 [Nocardia asteroides NBRC 15531]UGT48700.1 DUF6069 family protein [Nocardia asteroides]SFL68336.1 hypothetical protein SAMN05444423_101521 [Nocardia asteroides]VEG31669.1 Uncharacterised protein [Nocardia asteroides]GAD85480.1 hypothetical protein NCAST_31_01760 [Nocardia asteroides NBRC 15531]
MTDPRYNYGPANPQYPQGQEQQPPPKVNIGKLWAGGIGTAVVAALLVVVAIMLVRGVLGIAILAPEGAGTYGTVSTTSYALAAAGAALLATALLMVLLLAMPSPLTFFTWICLLVTAVAVILPFTLVADMDAKIATAVINLLVGLCITTMLSSVGSAAQNDARQGGY